MKDAYARFWARVKRGPVCWEWQGCKRDGYGLFCGENAHRFAWECFNGPISDGMQVLHHCDNRSCVRPLHLFLGTIQDNINDRNRKGRQARGAESGRATISEDVARQIIAMNPLRRRARWGEIRDIAKRFGIPDRQTVTDIWQRHTWRHL
jgi:hypothetical protein